MHRQRYEQEKNALFFIFLVTPTFSTVKMASVGLAATIVAKVCILIGGTGVYAVSTVLTNEIWFVLGMSIAVHMANVQNLAVSFVLGLTTCIAVILLVAAHEDKSGKAMRFLAKYTMPIFLLHTLFAAPMRSVLLKIGVTNEVAHIGLGLGVSFAGPIVAAWIMKKTKWLEFFLYPNKLMRSHG